MSSQARWPVLVAIATVVALLGSLVAVAQVPDEAADNPLIVGRGLGAPSPELEKVVADLSEFVERERGLEFRDPVDVAVLPDAGFEDRLLEDFEEEDQPELEKLSVLLKALGVIDPDEDLAEVFSGLLGLAVLGFYDSESGDLVVRGTGTTPYVRTTIVHELTHALDDQHYELHRPKLARADDEVGFGFSALVEGNARRIENVYRDQLSDDDAREADREELEFGSRAIGELASVPLLLVFLVQAPYEEGPDLVDAVLADGGEAALADAFADPPRTSDQVIDPERYLAGEAAVEVPHPEPDGRAVEDGVLGRLFLQLLLQEVMPGSAAEDAGEGWGGDWAVWWEEEGRSCVRAAVVGDDAGATTDLELALLTWAGQHPDASVTRTSPQGPIELNACA
jgi:hypothetical protein